MQLDPEDLQILLAEAAILGSDAAEKLATGTEEAMNNYLVNVMEAFLIVGTKEGCEVFLSLTRAFIEAVSPDKSIQALIKSRLLACSVDTPPNSLALKH